MFKQDSGSPFDGKLINKMKRYQKRPSKSLMSSDSIPFLPPLVPESPFTPPMQSLLEFSLPFSALARTNSSMSTPDSVTPRYRSSSTPGLLNTTPRSRSYKMFKSTTPNASSIFLSNPRSVSRTPPQPPLFTLPLSLSSVPLLYSSPLSMSSGRQTTKGPKVKAYMYTQSYQSPSSHLLLTKCSVCDEHLSQRLQNEVLVIFKDKLLMHAQCMQVMVTYNVESAIDKGTLTANLSEVDWISICFENMSVPSDREVVEEVISTMQAQFESKFEKVHEKPQSINFMRLANTLERLAPTSSKQSTPMTPTPMPSSLFVSEKPSAFDDWNDTKDNEEQRSCSTATPPAFSAPEKTKISGLGIFAATDMIEDRQILSDERLARLRIRDLTASTILSSLRSPSPDPSIMTVQTISANIECHRNVAPEALKTDFINVLLDSSSQVTLAHLVKLGELRIVDNLRVCLDGSRDETRTVYLFEHYLVVSPKNNVSEMIQFKLLECNVSTFGSLLQLTSSGHEIKLFSENRIIEKWVVAVCDRSIKFPVEIISSSIALPQYQTEEPTNAPHHQVSLSSATPDSASTIRALSLSHDIPAKDHISSTSSSSSTKTHINMDSDLMVSTDSDSDMDSDSDAELIEDALRSCPLNQKSILRPVFVAEAPTTSDVVAPKTTVLGWDDLVAQLDYALVH